MTTYNACWPIKDDSATLRELIAEATPDLERMIADTGHDIAGDVSWTTTDAGGLSLLASVDVEPTPPPTDRTTAIVEDVEFLLDADPSMTAEAIGSRLGLNKVSVLDALRPDRGDRPDLLTRLTANGREDGTRRSALAQTLRRVA